MDNENNQNDEGESTWLPISDLMAVLMVLFILLIGVNSDVISDEQEEQDEVVKIVPTEKVLGSTVFINSNITTTITKYITNTVYREIDKVTIDPTINLIRENLTQCQNEIRKILNNEDIKSLEEKGLGVEIDEENLKIRFNDPNLLFANGKAFLTKDFKKALDEFMPKFVDLLSNIEFKSILDGIDCKIVEVNIDGHTSSHFQAAATTIAAFQANMTLSQERSRNVLNYSLTLKNINDEWMRNYITANGLSSTKLIIENGIESKDQSRRVEIVIKINTDDYLNEINKQYCEIEKQNNFDNYIYSENKGLCISKFNDRYLDIKLLKNSKVI